MADDVIDLWRFLKTCLEEQNSSNLRWNDVKDIFERLKMLAKEPDFR
jgi:hypothetical protein